MDQVEDPVRKKFLMSMRKTKSRMFGEWFNKLKGTDGIYEFRVDNKGMFYRLFSFWDSRDGNQTLVVCTHGLVKKSNKTPKSEIDKAEEIRSRYFKGLI